MFLKFVVSIHFYDRKLSYRWSTFVYYASSSLVIFISFYESLIMIFIQLKYNARKKITIIIIEFSDFENVYCYLRK